MTTYTIVVNNESGTDQDYLYFNAAPTSSDKLGTAYSNVWITTPGTPNTGTQTVEVTVDDYAVCGRTSAPLANGVSVSEVSWVPVSLAAGSTSGTMPVVAMVNGSPEFEQPFGTVSLANSFGIHTKPFDGSLYPTAFIGLGKQNDKGKPVPVAIFHPAGDTTYELTPVVTFYVSTGNYEPGVAVDITTLGSFAAIDFTVAPSGFTMATVTHKSNGSYSKVTFSPPQ